VFEHLW